MSFNLAEQIIDRLQECGFKAYIVGGVVRDRLLDRPTGDIDIATSAKPDDVQQIFTKTIPVGIEHGTVIVRNGGQSFEVTTFRSEGRYIDYRRPSEVRFHESIEADLSRRDFTINALALDRDGSIIDPFGGQDDLEKGLLKAVGDPAERFQEDPLRMMRGIRFISTLGFSFEKQTYTALVQNAALLRKISIERIRDEFEKMLCGQFSEKAMKLLRETKVDHHLPEFPYAQQSQNNKYNWQELVTVEEHWAGFLTSHRVTDTESWQRIWKLPRQKGRRITRIVELVRMDLDFTSPYTLYEHGLALLKSVSRVKRFLGVEGMIQEDELEERYLALPIKTRSDLKLDGNALQQLFQRKPGRWIAEYMEGIERGVIEGKVTNSPSDLKEWIRKWDQQREND